MAAEYEIIAAQQLRVNPRNHAAWNEWGRGLFDEAIKMPSDIGEQMLLEAGRKFAIASELFPGEVAYWQNCGAALLERAKRDTTGNAVPLLDEATALYEKAIRLSSRQSGPWQGAALCYHERATRAVSLDCGPLFEAAFIRFAVATELAPRRYDTWENWGIALFRCAQQLDNEQSLSLLMESVEKSNHAALLQPGSYAPLNNAALALLDLARRMPGAPSSPDWLAEADAKLLQGIAITPDTALLWANRGHVVHARSRKVGQSSRKTLLAEADTLYRVAHEKEPDSGKFFITWGVVHIELGETALTDEEATAHFTVAEARFRSCAENEPRTALLWTNWSVLHTAWGSISEPEEAQKHFKEACEKFAVANSLHQNAFESLQASSLALIHWAKHVNEPRQFEAMLNEAQVKIDKAIKLNPYVFGVWITKGYLFRQKAVRETDTEIRETWLLQARECYETANRFDRNAGVYDLACVAALRGKTEECRRLLQDGLARDLLPVKRWINRDQDFTSVREEEWFRELLERLS